MLKVVHGETEPNATTASAASSSLLDEIVGDGAWQMLAAAGGEQRLLRASGGDQRVRCRSSSHGSTTSRIDPVTGERMRFSSAILPAWSRKSPQVSEALPPLYLHGLSTTDFASAVGAVGREMLGVSMSIKAIRPRA